MQLERLQGGRERLLESYEIVRRTLDEATNELQGSLKAAKQVADAAARRVEAEPAATAEQLEAEVEAARAAGLPLVEDEPELEDFADELPEGEMVPIEPSADFEEVRVIEEPEIEVVEVVEIVELVELVDEIVVVEEVVIVEEIEDDEETEATAVDVDDLFARIRAARAEEVAKAHEVLAETLVADELVVEEPVAAEEPEQPADPVEEAADVEAADEYARAVVAP